MPETPDYDESKGMSADQLADAIAKSQADAIRAEARWLKQVDGKSDRVIIGETEAATIWLPKPPERSSLHGPRLPRRQREKLRDQHAHGQREGMRSFMWGAAIRQYEADRQLERRRAIRQLFDDAVADLDDADLRKHCQAWQKANPPD